MQSGNSALRYVDASRIHSRSGELSGVYLRGSDDQRIGNLNGVLIDTATRRLRYFVVESPAWFGSRKYLLPTEWPAQVGPGGKCLRFELDADDLARCEEFEGSTVQPYGDDDTVDALFSERIA